MNETFRRLLLLMWKNWLMQRRRRMKMVVDIFIPLFIAAFLLFVRYQVEVTTYESITSYKPFSVDYIPQFPMMNPALFKMKNISLSGSETSSDRILRDALLPENILDAIIIPRAILVSSPDTEPVGDLMTKVCTKLGAFCIRAENSEELEKIMTVRNDKLPRPRDILLAGVAFPEVSSKIETSLDQVRIRFPAELRFPYRKGIGGVPRNWVTGLTFPMFQVPGPRDAGADKGGIPGYYEEGFLGIQNAISSSLLETRLGSSETNPLPKLNITLKRYPYPSYDIDPLLVVMQNILPFLFVVSFLFSLNTIVEKITTEKERRLKVVMKIMGLSDSLRWTSWFIYSFLFLGLLVTILLIVLKVEFFYDRAVFPHSDWSCLAVFLFTYACATITFAFLISSLLQKASVASIVSGMAWFLMYMPFYIIQRKYAEINTTVKCLTSLFLNTGMGIGFQIILMFESAGVGSQWDNFAKSASPDDGMSMLLVIAMMWLDCLIYLCLALYIENVFPGKYGTPLPYYYPFQRSYWSNKETKNTSRADENLNSLENVDYPLEEPPKGLNAGVQIKNLRKVYGKKNKPAVKNLCFNAYEGQITALLGFNGAGKTTTLSILTGIYPPTSGTAVVAGYDIRTNMKDVRRNLGFCPQYNVLFDELTVKEHLKFFGSLRGLNEAEVKEDTEKYLNLLKLKDKKNTLAKYLSGGMKRKLSVTLAMCGNTKVLIFDEPTAGMDPRARRSLWDLLKGAKKGRTIIITTHHLDEADLLGDRVAIMSEGKLDCHGSTFFLKQHYSCGYHLIIVKKDNCDVQKVTDLVRKHIPEEIKPEDVGMELSYQLDKKYLNRFEKLFSAIEREKVALKITNFGVTHTSLEDVFKSIADGAKRQTETEIKEVPLNERKRDHDVTVNVPESEKLSGFPLLRNRVLAMFYKYVKSSLRSWKSYLMLLVMTVAGVGTGIFTIRVNNSLLDLPPRTMDLQNFPNPIVSVQATESCKGICRKYFEAYRDAMLKDNVKVVSLNSSVDIDEYLLGECDKDIFNYRGKNVLATTFSVDSEDRVQITGSFNGVPYHLPPTALSYIYNAIFKTAVDPQAGLTIINEPLPYKEETKVNIQGTILNTGFQVAIFVCFTYVFVASYFIVFPVIERGIKAKHLQFVSGVGIITFWSTCYLWNFLMSLGPNITLLIALAAFQEDGFKEADELGYCAVALLFFFLAVLPLMYVGSLMFSKPSLGFTLMSFFNIITGMYTLMLILILRLLDFKDLAHDLDWVFSLFPLYLLGRSIQNIYIFSSKQEKCKLLPKPLVDACLEKVGSIWDWDEPGIGRNLTLSVIDGVFLFILLIIIESGVFNFLKRKGAPVVDSQKERDNDVSAERAKVTAIPLEERASDYGLIINGITKSFNKNVAVNNLYLVVANGECFGLLGANGAGKTTTFRILTGDEFPSSGNVYVKGFNLKKDLHKIHRLTGYCPQFDALFDNLTGREHLRIYCLLRGIPPADIEQTSVRLARELLFEEFLDKKAGDYSGGNKRKLSTALALIGNPPVVYLDEPTAGIDPVAKRHIWAVVTKLRAQGTTIILTSHSMEECEALCTRLTVMVKGEFKCLGSVQYLKGKFCSGYSLAIKVRKYIPTEGGEASNPGKSSQFYIGEIKKFVAQNFPGAKEIEEHEELLVYRIPLSDITWSQIFGLIESVKNQFNIEDYSVGQTTLEDILLMFTGTSDDETQ